MKDTIIKKLFTERFRPKSLDVLIAPQRIKSELSKGLIQNLLLFGGPGTGKSSTLFILAKNHPTKYINASSERGIETIREEISRFCASISLLDGRENLKCVILDEIDNATNDFFMALRAVMEKYSKTARFIASCNHINKIPIEIQSRFQKISYDSINNEEEKYLIGEYYKRISLILNKLKISYTSKILEKFIRDDFPDMRSLMQKLQSFYIKGIKELNDENFYSHFDFKDLFELCLNKPDKPYNNYKFVMSGYATRIDDSLLALGNDFPEYLKSKYPDKISKLPVILITLAEYQYQKAFTIDPVITLLATIYRIQQILNNN